MKRHSNNGMIHVLKYLPLYFCMFALMDLENEYVL